MSGNMPLCFDKAEYQFEDAVKSYCSMYDRQESELSDKDYNEIWRYAGNHIGFFITWVIRKGFLGELHTSDPDDTAAAEKVKTGEMLGVDFLLEFCDGKLYPEDMTDEAAEFAADFYESSYLKIYTDFVADELADLPLEFIGTWEDYLAFEPILEKCFEDRQKRETSGTDSFSQTSPEPKKDNVLDRKWKLL
ncbi:MAG: hypothetical protein NC078_05875 [Ruminococcus sp.]|nr:hypothetical protein [Ruminococcus sp.]